MHTDFFFGYGSLVNRATHDYAPAHKAAARGWRRAWRATPERQIAFLTVIPDDTCTIDGLIAPVPGQDWAALDAREFAYDRLAAAHQVTHETQAGDIAIYAIAPSKLKAPSENTPVLLSYLDVVLQGYLAEFGQDGIQAFLRTTTGWEAPFLNDRAKPRYPRAQRLTRLERQLTDAALVSMGAKIIEDQDG